MDVFELNYPISCRPFGLIVEEVFEGKGERKSVSYGDSRAKIKITAPDAQRVTGIVIRSQVVFPEDGKERPV